MAGAMFRIWIMLTILVAANLVHGSTNFGVNWGSQASHLLNPSIVTTMLKDNGIKKAKLFDADSWTVSALAGTGIEVMLGIPNDQLSRFSGKYSHAKDWVKENVTKHLYNGGVEIKYIAVGNEPFLKSYNGSFLKTALPSLQNIQKALNEAGIGDKIKATIPLNADVYSSPSDMPSDGDFRSDIKDLMVDIVTFLHSNKAPFVVNIYPFLSLYQNKDFPVEFAFFDGNKRKRDKGVEYTNVFDANYDTLVWTLKKNKMSDMKIVVGEVGWPTESHAYATNKYAQKFYDGLFKKLAANKGTPLRPGHLEVYLFSLFDEDLKSVAPGPFERHWGIFNFDGTPKFKVDFSGQGNDKFPVAAKGVKYLPNQWCVLDPQANKNAAAREIDYACANGDCTALYYGSSCSNLDSSGNISYAFNMYFQLRDQDVEACDFDGVGKLVKEDPSKGSCKFIVQIESVGQRLSFGFGVSVLLSSVLFLFL